MPRKKKNENEEHKNGHNGELNKIIRFSFENIKDEKQVWTAIVEAYNKKYNTNLPTNTDQIAEIIANYDAKYDSFYAKSIKVAIMQIMAGIIDIIREAISRIHETGLANLDEKEMIIVIEKMSMQIKMLADLYNKLFKTKDDEDDSGGGFQIKVL